MSPLSITFLLQPDRNTGSSCEDRGNFGALLHQITCHKARCLEKHSSGLTRSNVLPCSSSCFCFFQRTVCLQKQLAISRLSTVSLYTSMMRLLQTINISLRDTAWDESMLRLVMSGVWTTVFRVIDLVVDVHVGLWNGCQDRMWCDLQAKRRIPVFWYGFRYHNEKEWRRDLCKMWYCGEPRLECLWFCWLFAPCHVSAVGKVVLVDSRSNVRSRQRLTAIWRKQKRRYLF